MASKNIQKVIRNIFDPNLTQNITANDFQTFVDAIFESSESIIRRFKSLSEIEEFRLSDAKIFIEKGDIIIINGPDLKENGIYFADVSKPSASDVTKISRDDVLFEGKPGDVLHSGKTPYWAPIENGYYIKGKKKINDILGLHFEPKGTIYIAEDENWTVSVGGFAGDGYSYDGQKWNNIGSIVGPKGEVTKLEIASADETNKGSIDNKAISPLGLKNSKLLDQKEDVLGYPTKDGQVVASTVSGGRYWKDQATTIQELTDIDIKLPVVGDTLIYEDRKWQNKPQTKFVETINRPTSPYAGEMIFDATLNMPLWFNANTNSWVDATGATK